MVLVLVGQTRKSGTVVDVNTPRLSGLPLRMPYIATVGGRACLSERIGYHNRSKEDRVEAVMPSRPIHRDGFNGDKRVIEKRISAK